MICLSIYLLLVPRLHASRNWHTGVPLGLPPMLPQSNIMGGVGLPACYVFPL